jgi:hypothetical protein
MFLMLRLIREYFIDCCLNIDVCSRVFPDGTHGALEHVSKVAARASGGVPPPQYVSRTKERRSSKSRL